MIIFYCPISFNIFRNHQSAFFSLAIDSEALGVLSTASLCPLPLLFERFFNRSSSLGVSVYCLPSRRDFLHRPITFDLFACCCRLWLRQQFFPWIHWIAFSLSFSWWISGGRRNFIKIHVITSLGSPGVLQSDAVSCGKCGVLPVVARPPDPATSTTISGMRRKGADNEKHIS